MRIFYAGVDKKYLLSSLQTDCLISCKIVIDVFKHHEQFIKRVEFYSWHKEVAETVINVVYRDIFDYLVIRYIVIGQNVGHKLTKCLTLCYTKGKLDDTNG